MRNGINIWSLEGLIKSTQSCAAEIEGKWVPARPYGWSDWKTKLRAIKLILTDKADLVIWPGKQ